jgi:hypothetical protein
MIRIASVRTSVVMLSMCTNQPYWIPGVQPLCRTCVSKACVLLNSNALFQ